MIASLCHAMPVDAPWMLPCWCPGAGADATPEFPTLRDTWSEVGTYHPLLGLCQRRANPYLGDVGVVLLPDPADPLSVSSY